MEGRKGFKMLFKLYYNYQIFYIDKYCININININDISY